MGAHKGVFQQKITNKAESFLRFFAYQIKEQTNVQTRKISETLTDYVHSQSMVFWVNRMAGQVYSRINDIVQGIGTIIFECWNAVVMLLMALVNSFALFTVNKYVALSFIFIFLFRAFFMWRMRKPIKRSAQDVSDSNAKLTGKMDLHVMGKVQLEVLVKYREALSQGKNARTVELDNKDQEAAARDLFLLTNKPVMYVCNVDEASAVKGNAYVEQVREAVKDEDAQVLVLAAKIESEIAELESYEERQLFLEEIGLQESGVNRLIKAAYALLNLRTFLTAGSDEVRAWTFKAGAKAPQCAGVIHTDFERGFIRAEVIKYEDYIALGCEAQCRAAGKLGIVGKDYVVQDGDIMHFLFNV